MTEFCPHYPLCNQLFCGLLPGAAEAPGPRKRCCWGGAARDLHMFYLKEATLNEKKYIIGLQTMLPSLEAPSALKGFALPADHWTYGQMNKYMK